MSDSRDTFQGDATDICTVLMNHADTANFFKYPEKAKGEKRVKLDASLITAKKELFKEELDEYLKRNRRLTSEINKNLDKKRAPRKSI